MSAIYDNWEKLVDAVVKREQYRQLCLAPEHSRSSSIISEDSSDSSSSNLSSFHYHVEFDFSGTASSSTSRQPAETGSNTQRSVMQRDLSILDGHREKGKSKAMKAAVSNISGVVSLAMNMMEKKLTGVGKLTKLRETQNGGAQLKRLLSSNASTRNLMTRFSAKVLKKATNNYAEDMILGRGSFGVVYKGVLHDSQLVAVKKPSTVDSNILEDFFTEAVTLSQINHRNIVKILGCCVELNFPILVYEYVAGNTLYFHIHDSGADPCLSWDNRLRIATEVAGVLAYLHSAASMLIIHSDVKSSNILLDEYGATKLSGFGSSISLPIDETGGLETPVQGTPGYLDPEYFYTHILAEKSDVYSFGVVLAELLTGRKPLSPYETFERRSLAMLFLTSLQDNQLVQILDTHMGEGNFNQISCVAELAKRCLCIAGEDRPTMKEVAIELDGLRNFTTHQLPRVQIREDDTGSTSEDDTGSMSEETPELYDVPNNPEAEQI